MSISLNAIQESSGLITGNRVQAFLAPFTPEQQTNYSNVDWKEVHKCSDEPANLTTFLDSLETWQLHAWGNILQELQCKFIESQNDRSRSMFVEIKDGMAIFDDGRKFCETSVIIFFNSTRPDMHDYSEYAKAIEAFKASRGEL